LITQELEQQGVNNMRTVRIQIILVGLMLLGGFGCGKKLFQSLLQQAPTSVTQYEWRLIETNDRQLQSWNLCYDFIVSKFSAQYEGLLKKVSGNVMQEDEKAAKFTYFVQQNKQVMCIDYRLGTAPTQASSVANLATLCNNGSTAVYRYKYELSREGLILREINSSGNFTGVYYHYVDFRGALNPDQQCNL
jgi:hypothetical protein